MDFIVELLKSKDMTTIMVAVYRLTKMAHFIPFRCLPTTSIAADDFISNIFNIRNNQSINQSPFFANYGFNPKFSPETPSSERPSRAEKRILDINKNIEFLKRNLEEAKKTYKKYADLKRLPSPNFEVSKKVWLLRGSTTKKVKRKLADQLIDPFEIIEKVSPLAYKLKLPNNMHCHPIFHVSLLEPYYENEFEDRNVNRRKSINLTTIILI